MLISDILRNNLTSELIEGYESRKDKSGLVCETTNPSDLNENIENLSSALYHKLKVRKGDKVAILSENRRQWLKFFLAAVNIGAVAVPIDIDHDKEKVHYILGHSESKVLLASKKGLTKGCKNGETKLEGTSLERLVLLDTDEIDRRGIKAKKIYGFEELLKHKEKKHKQVVFEEDLAMINYTSGTSGFPKGVMLSHKNMISNIKGIADRINDIGSNDNVAIILPLHHTFPLIVALTALYKEASVTLASSHRKFPDIIKHTKPTVMLAVPVMLEKMYHKIDKTIKKKGKIASTLFNLATKNRYTRHLVNDIYVESFFPGLRFIVSGGAKLEPDVVKNFLKLGISVINGYGATELSPVAAVQEYDFDKFFTTDYYFDHAGEVGKPLFNVDCFIDEDSVLYVSGPNVMQGYYKDEKVTREAFITKDNNKYYNTKDIAEFTEDGGLLIKGRADNVINLANGERISSTDIQRKILLDNMVEEAWVYQSENCIKAAVYLDYSILKKKYGDVYDADIEEAAKKVIKNVNRKLSINSKIKEYSLLDTPLPKTSKLSIRYKEVMTLAENNEFCLKTFVENNAKYINKR